MMTEAENIAPPCSPHCYNHVTHPCEKCGRLQGRKAKRYSELVVEVAEKDKEIARLRALLDSRGDVA